MSQVAFISDIDTPLGFQLARLYLQEENRVFATKSGNEAQVSEEELKSLQGTAGDALLVETWNRSSPISAKNMFLAALNRFGTPDEVLLIGHSHRSIPALHEASFETIEKSVDCWIKGNLFLLKTVLHSYLEKRRGTIALINERSENSSSPLEGTIDRSFAGLAHSLLTAYSDHGVSVVAFESAVEQAEDYAVYIFRCLKETRGKTTGKWMRFRRGIFGGFKPGN
jgi:hypothetical protein